MVAILAVVTELSAKSTVLTAPFTIFAEVTALSASSLLVIESAAILAVVTLLLAIFAVLTCAFANCKDVTALFAISLEPTEFSAIFAEVIELSAKSAVAIVPFTILAEVTELSAIALAVPVKSPSTSTTRVPFVIDKSPVEEPVNVPVPIVNLSALSSNPMKILLELPLSPTIPISPEGEPDCPFASSINLSVITVFVEEAVVVLPVTSKFPENVTLPVNVCPLSASDLSSAADTALAAICTAVTASVAISLAPT